MESKKLITKKIGKPLNSLKVNNTFLINPWIKKEISKEIEKPMDLKMDYERCRHLSMGMRVKL